MRKIPPVLYMNISGIAVDEYTRQSVLNTYRKELRSLQSAFDEICEAVLGFRVNWKSHVQLKHLFYSTFGLKPVRKRNAKGQFVPTVNADALERFTLYLYPQIFARYILELRDLGKKISFLETEIDDDGRIRTSLNIAGTDTGRMSSRFSVFGTGTNLQNVENQLRRPMVPDPGHVFVNVDLEQADARNVGARIWNIFYESHGPEAAGRYLDACESGDLHTTVCAMAWKELDWPSPWDLTRAREIAEQIAYKTHTYRDMSKKLGHGTNYFGEPRTMAKHAKTDQAIIEQFQARYFNAFPLIGNRQHDLSKNDWHGWVQRQLIETGELTNLFGRRRYFFGRPKDPRTLRAAIAYDPQSNTGEELDRGWLQLWDGMPEARLSIPVHDSILFQLPFEGLSELLPRALSLLRVEIELAGGRLFSVPLEAKVGWNWADSKKNKKTGLWENEYGLRKWTGKEDRYPPARKSRLSRII